MINPDEWLGVGEVAGELGISRARVHAIAKTRPFGRMVAGRLLFTRAEVDAFKQQPRPQGVHLKSERRPLRAEASPA